MIQVISKGYPYKPDKGCFGYASSIIINDNKVILFDTGSYGIRQAINKYISKIDIVIISHLHFDHCSNLDLFIDTGIPIYISEKELAYYNESNKKDLDLFSYFNIIKDKLNIIAVTEEISLTNNTKIIFTEGHTPGHMSLEVERDTILAGDSLKTFQDYKNENKFGNAVDPDKYIATKKRIKNRYQYIYPGHDSKIVNGKKGVEMEIIKF